MSNNALKACPRCGTQVYQSAWPRHDRDCASIAARFGSVRAMAALFRADDRLTTADLARQLPGVNVHVVHRTLIAAGVTPDEIAARAKPDDRSLHCRRCDVLLDARGVVRSVSDPTLCGWCEGTAPDGRAEPPDIYPVEVGGITCQV